MWDSNAATDGSDGERLARLAKCGYSLGITVNVLGELFFDEGADVCKATYAKFGRAIVGQLDGISHGYEPTLLIVYQVPECRYILFQVPSAAVCT